MMVIIYIFFCFAYLLLLLIIIINFLAYLLLLLFIYYYFYYYYYYYYFILPPLLSSSSFFLYLFFACMKQIPPRDIPFLLQVELYETLTTTIAHCHNGGGSSKQVISTDDAKRRISAEDLERLSYAYGKLHSNRASYRSSFEVGVPLLFLISASCVST